MQIQIAFMHDYPAVFDTKDLTDASNIDGVMVASFVQLSYSQSEHVDPKTGTGAYAPGLWCHAFGYDFARRDGAGVIPLVEIGHMPVLSAAALEGVLEVRAGGVPMLKRTQDYGLIDLQTLYTVADTYLDGSASMSFNSLLAELDKYFAHVNPEKSPDEIAELVAEEASIPAEVVVAAIAAAAAQEAAEADAFGGLFGALDAAAARAMETTVPAEACGEDGDDSFDDAPGYRDDDEF